MADKPPLAPKPPIGQAPLSKPRKKGPPPKPVPYHKHKEHKEHDVSTFKSNYPISKAAPPVPLEKPVRRYSAKGEPSAEFARPKKEVEKPIQYSIPIIPGMNAKKEAKTGTKPDVRPRLDTPIVPPEPSTGLSNGSKSTLEIVNKAGINSDVRPHLDTPFVPPEPTTELSNGSNSKESTVGTFESVSAKGEKHYMIMYLLVLL